MAGIQNILPSLCKSAHTNYKHLKKGASTLGQQVKYSVKTTYNSMSCQSVDNIIGSSEFTQQQEAYNSATKIQSLTRGYFTRKTIRQNLETQSVPFSKLPDGALITMCSLLDLNTRFSLTKTSKQFSPLETGQIQTQSLGTAALQKLAIDEATQWINDQLKSVDQDPIKLIKKIENSKLTIPDYLAVRITRNIMINQAIESANTIPDDRSKSGGLLVICKTLSANGNIDQAIDLAHTIPNDECKTYALGDICRTLLTNGNIDQAIEFANTISNDECKTSALRFICRTLLTNGNIDQAIEFANTISDDIHKSRTLGDICEHLLVNENIHQAIEFANRISDDIHKSRATKGYL